MKVCPKQGRRSATRRGAALSACALALVALALPGTAWLDQMPDLVRGGSFAFRAPPPPSSAVPDFENSPALTVFSGRSPMLESARADSTPGFRTRSEPFKPRTTPTVGPPISPSRDFSRQTTGAVLPGPLSARLSESSEVEAEGALDELETTYRLALATFGTQFGAGRGRPAVNPFQQALETSSTPAPGPAGDTGAGTLATSGPDTGGEQGSGEGATPPVDQPLPEVPPDGGSVEDPPPLSFLVAGGAFEEFSVQRAAVQDDGTYLLEDASELNPFAGASFGFVRPQVIFGERDQMVTADLNGDGPARHRESARAVPGGCGRGAHQVRQRL